MGLISEVAELKNEYRQAEIRRKEDLKKIARLEKIQQKAKEKKQYEKDLLIAVENELISTFCDYFEKTTPEQGYLHLTLLKTRNEILENITESTIEYDYLDKNYEKILNKVKTRYYNDYKAKEQLNINIYEESENQISTLEVILKVLGKLIKYAILCSFGMIYLILRVLFNLASKEK